MSSRSGADQTRAMFNGGLHEQKVLDHGYVKFLDLMGTDESIIEAARMSTGRGFISWEPYERCESCGVAWKVPLSQPVEFLTPLPSPTDCGPLEHRGPIAKMPRGDLGLLEFMHSGSYLTQPPHSGPFERCELVIEQQHPILVERQYARHRTLIAMFSLNEFSARYAVLPELFYIPSPERLRHAAQDAKSRQSSGGELSDATVERITAEIVQCNGNARAIYEGLIGQGLAKELARGVIGVFQYTRLQRKANLRNWLQAAELRLDLHAQWEAQQTFEPIKALLAALWPKTWALFLEYTLGAVRFSKTEIECLKGLIDVLRGWQLPGTDAIKDMPFYPLGSAAKKAAFLKKLGIES